VHTYNFGGSGSSLTITGLKVGMITYVHLCSVIVFLWAKKNKCKSDSLGDASNISQQVLYEPNTSRLV